MKSIIKLIALILWGFSSFSIIYTADYDAHISTPETLSRRSWERTGAFLKQAMENIGGLKHGEAAEKC